MAEAGAFKFGFAAPAAVQQQQEQEEEQEQDATEQIQYQGRTAPLHPAAEVPSHPRPTEPLQNAEQVEIVPGIVLLKGRVNAAEAASLVGDKRVEDSDLVPEVYEGGFKLWEGAIDLCRFLVQKYGLTADNLLSGSGSGSPPLQGKRVLELGCGHGMPGILAMLAGAEVHFQDFNREVLAQLTLPNVAANMGRLPPGRTHPACRLFHGDWRGVGELLTHRGFGGHYDIIMTSESIYCIDSQYKLLECIKQVLQPPHGVVYVAAKSYYFGVGGGIKTFTHAVKQDGIFEVNHVYKTSEDVTGCVTPVTTAAVAPGSTTAEPGGTAVAGPDARPAATAIVQQQPEGAGEKEKEGEAERGVQEGGGAHGAQSEGGAGKVGAAGGGKVQQGGNVREVLELSFPLSIQPYFL